MNIPDPNDHRERDRVYTLGRIYISSLSSPFSSLSLPPPSIVSTRQFPRQFRPGTKVGISKVRWSKHLVTRGDKIDQGVAKKRCGYRRHFIGHLYIGVSVLFLPSASNFFHGSRFFELVETIIRNGSGLRRKGFWSSRYATTLARDLIITLDGRVISAVEGRKKGGKHPESRLNDTRSILYIFMARDDVCFVERRLASCARSYRR